MYTEVSKVTEKHNAITIFLQIKVMHMKIANYRNVDNFSDIKDDLKSTKTIWIQIFMLYSLDT